ncbi:hypothetical protein FPV67DRAFT_1666699 [Lyophyllum atratum]|nr:hypothetical protein FPV67DRAFT_1666699 [Lyophyllum atratum]
MHALPITPRSSLDQPNSPPIASAPDVAKVVLLDDLPRPVPAIEGPSRTHQASTTSFPHSHTPPPSPPKPSHTPAKPRAPIQIPPRALKKLKHFLDRELYGWGGQGIRLSLFSGTLILKYPTRQHEFVTRLFKKVALPHGIVGGGADDITLFNSTKTPDYCLYDARHPPLSTSGPGSGLRRPAFENFPTVIFEVAYSQTRRKVSEAAARTIGGSFGAIKLVVAIKLQYVTLKSNGVRPPIETAIADYWMVTKVEELGKYSGPVNCLLPAGGPLPNSGQQDSEEEDDGGDGDGDAEYVDDGSDGDGDGDDDDDDDDGDANADTDDEDNNSTTIPTAYRYVMRNKDAGDGKEGLVGGFSVLHVHRTETYTILPKAPDEPPMESPASASASPPQLPSLNFYYSQLYHGKCPPYMNEDHPILRIPYADIRSVLRHTEEQQAGDDLFRGTKRRRGFLENAKMSAEQNQKRLRLG